MTAIAVKSFETEATRYTVSPVAGIARSGSAGPKPFAHRRRPSSTTAMENVGMSWSAISWAMYASSLSKTGPCSGVAAHPPAKKTRRRTSGRRRMDGRDKVEGEGE